MCRNEVRFPATIWLKIILDNPEMKESQVETCCGSSIIQIKHPDQPGPHEALLAEFDIHRTLESCAAFSLFQPSGLFRGKGPPFKPKPASSCFSSQCMACISFSLLSSTDLPNVVDENVDKLLHGMVLCILFIAISLPLPFCAHRMMKEMKEKKELCEMHCAIAH